MKPINSMITSKNELPDIKNSNVDAKHLVEAFYTLRKTFETEYSGKLRSHKYEETRNFTIALNYAIFQANQLDCDQEKTEKSLHELALTLQAIKQDYLKLNG